MNHKFVLLPVILMLTMVAGSAQQQPPRPRPPFSVPDCAPGDRICEQQKRDRDKAINKQRQENLKRDTDKLYQLATELKQAVDKTNENVLSVEVIRKTDEIEKLAKDINKKMKNE